MLPKYHILFGFLFSLILYLLFPFVGLLGFLTIFLSSFLIDIDHYLYYVFKKKDLNLKSAYYFFIKKPKINPAMYFLHGIEVLSILFILGLFLNNLFLFIFIGFVFHLFLDVIWMVYFGFGLSKISLIWDLARLKH